MHGLVQMHSLILRPLEFSRFIYGEHFDDLRLRQTAAVHTYDTQTRSLG
jgi:hypothetical protein